MCWRPTSRRRRRSASWPRRPWSGYPKLDVLVNNAGAINTQRQLTGGGVELTWAVNHLAPFLLTTLLEDRLKASAPARVITTSSNAHQGAHVPFDDLAAERSYGLQGFERYGQSKLANILFTRELARRQERTPVGTACRIDDPAAQIEDLGEIRLCATRTRCFAQAGVRLAHQRGDVGATRA